MGFNTGILLSLFGFYLTSRCFSSALLDMEPGMGTLDGSRQSTPRSPPP